MNIILCGMMGSGKTTVGIRLSELTGMRWYDTDDLIVDKYGRIADIFEYYGEERFRQLETGIVHRVAGRKTASSRRAVGACCARKTAPPSKRGAARSSF